MPLSDEPDLTRELDAAEAVAMAGNDPDGTAGRIWALADEVGNTKLAWRHVLTAKERAAFDVVTQRLLRLGTQVKRGEVE